MNRKDYTIKSKAIADIKTIADYIAQDKKSAALKLVEMFNKTFEKLAQFPDLGTVRKDFTYLNVRFFVVKKHYLIIYNIEDEKVCILRVLTSYQDICSML